MTGMNEDVNALTEQVNASVGDIEERENEVEEGGETRMKCADKKCDEPSGEGDW